LQQNRRDKLLDFDRRKTKMRVVSIHWDADYDADGNYLPTEVEIPKELTDECEIADWLSDTYGFCHCGFRIEMTEEERQDYCKGCARSIYSDGPLARSCDMNVADNGYYNHANYPCYTRVDKKED
jgi:hypothetical protein